MHGWVAGRFELIDQIGSGGAGTVWRAYDHREHCLCAAKIIQQRDVGSLLRVLREQGVRLRHPHIVSPYSWHADDDVVLLASELLHGGSVATLLGDYGALPWRYGAELLEQVFSAVEQVHTAGLLHRDIKPSNVLLASTGQGYPDARLADFGIAYDLGGPRLTQTGFAVGTPGYLAPEIFSGHGPHHAQDLFALGVLSCQVLTGERPENRRDDEVPAGVPEPVWDVVNALLRTAPEDRPGTAGEARALLADAVGGVALSLPAYTADGQPVEVLDTLPPRPGPAKVRAATATLESPEQHQQQHRQRRRGSHRIAAFAAGAVLVAAAVATTMLLLTESSNTPTDPGGEQPVPGSSPAPSAPADPNAEAGAACDWQDVGSTVTTTEGDTVRCMHDQGRYRWENVP